MYPPGDCTRVPYIVKAPAEHRPRPVQAKSGPHRLPPWSRRGPGRVSCVLFFKNCPRVPGGSRQGPLRAPVGQITGLIRGIFLAGARVTFKLVLKVTRGPRGVKKWTVPGRGPSGSRVVRPKTARELSGKAPFVKCDQGISGFV